jgi:OOP family OmpA-OmpF porin
MTTYTQDGLRDAVNKVKVGGLTPLAQPLEDAVGDLSQTTGKIAVILVSDGIDTKQQSPVAAAEKLKKAYGDRICIYTILIGDNPMGKKNLEDIAQAGQCGFATTEAAVATGEGMADFVEKVFLQKQRAAAKPQPIAAPSTVPSAPPAQYETVTVNLLVEFDFDKTTIRPREADQLDEFGAFLKKYPQTIAVLEGHTDNYGTKEYNMDLSMRRAESVKKYLVTKFNIASSRLSTKGFGYSRPIATNKTDSGRQKNRRVEAAISTTVKK